jgi:ABC-type antimicrobial peptide transport system permease subunit
MNTNIKMILNEEYGGEGRPRGRKLNVVGILAESNGEYNWNAYMDIDQLTKIQEEVARRNKNSETNDRRRHDDDENKYESVKVKVDDMKNVKEVQDQIKALGLEAWSLTDILENMKQTSAGIQAVLGGIGAVSLFVAALGITNTMIMSIYERTREIGVMKVLGAELKDIKRLFLFEAGLIGLLGGLVGIVLSIGISKLINNIGFNFMNGGYGDASSISVIPLWLIGLSLVFSILVGVLSGYYPARRAMRLSALEAIRTDS